MISPNCWRCCRPTQLSEATAEEAAACVAAAQRVLDAVVIDPA
jgi:hypothetical protein